MGSSEHGSTLDFSYLFIIFLLFKIILIGRLALLVRDQPLYHLLSVPVLYPNHHIQHAP